MSDERTQDLGSLLSELFAERLKAADLDVFIDQACERLRAAKTPVTDDDMGMMYEEAAAKALATRMRITSGDAENVYIPTGFLDLDDIITGLRRGRLVTITAPTGAGKSAFIHNVVEHTGIRGIRSTIFSLEMSNEEIGDRTLAHYGERDHRALTRWVESLKGVPVRIFDQPASLPEIVNKTRQLAENGLDLIVVDYAQLVRPTGKTERRERAVAEVSGTLKNLSRELDIIVIAAAQLNRGGDIRESAAIEHDSDLWLTIDEQEEGSTIVSLTIKKNRHGERRTFQLRWSGDKVSFENLGKEAAF